MADINIAENAIVAQKAKLVGDDDVQAEVTKVDPQITKEAVAAQVAPPREADAKKVNVHETRVATDTVITDPSSPLAVQVPDAGKSPLLTDGLPVHQLAEGNVEDRLAAQADEADSDDDAPASE